MTEARDVATHVIERVWTEDAFAAAALDAELTRRAMDPRDAGLATELVYGVLRTEAFLDAKLSKAALHGQINFRGAARAQLFIGAYTICFLDRVPAFAAVSEAVDGVRAADGERAAAFANALLRKLATEPKPRLATALAESAPGWLRGSLRKVVGRAGVGEYLAAGPIPPPIGLALAPNEDRADWIDKLLEVAPNAAIEAGRASRFAINVRGAGDVRRLPGVNEAWIVQEEGAQRVAIEVGAMPGDTILDACSGRGNKAWILGHAVGPTGAVDCADLYDAKIGKLMSGPVAQLVRKAFAIDWTVDGAGRDLEGAYDRVLVDAPCSGTGTLRRRPEIARGRTVEDLERLAELQLRILVTAARAAKVGGEIAYAVCSVLREEAEAVLEKACASDDVRLEVIGTPLRLLPHVDGTDGYFVARLRRG